MNRIDLQSDFNSKFNSNGQRGISGTTLNSGFTNFLASIYTQDESDNNYLSANTNLTLYVNTGSTQTITGLKNFVNGINISGYTINNISNDTQLTNASQTSLVTEYAAKKYIDPPIILVMGVVSYTATTYGYYFVDTSLGAVNIYIPDSSVNNTSKQISVRKFSSTDGNYVNVYTISGQLFDNGTNIFSIYKVNHGFTLISTGGYWKTIDDDRTGKYKIIVGNENSDFTSIKSAVDWSNLYLPVPAEIYVKSGTYYVDNTITITNNNIISIIGDGYFSTNIKPTINLTGKTMFDIRTGTILSNLYIDGTDLGSGINSYKDTVGSVAIKYSGSTSKLYFDNLRVSYVYNVANFPYQILTTKFNNSSFLYIGGDGFIMDDGTYMIMIGCSIRYCNGQSIRVKNSTSNLTTTQFFAQACRFYGQSTNYSNGILTLENNSNAVLSDIYILIMLKVDLQLKIHQY
jgi:hypothetical protein